MAYNQQNFDRPQGSGISILFALVLALLAGLGGFVAGYYSNTCPQPDPREIVRSLDNTEITDTTEMEEPVVDSTAPGRVEKVNTDSIRQKRMMKR